LLEFFVGHVRNNILVIFTIATVNELLRYPALVVTVLSGFGSLRPGAELVVCPGGSHLL